MKNSIKFYAPIWLLVLITSFGLFSCNSEDITTDENDPNIPSNSSGIAFVIVDREYNNLFQDKNNSFYDMDYIHIITSDGKYKDNLKTQYIERNESIPVPYYIGYSFISPLLAQIDESGNYDKKYWKTQYADKPLYLHLSPNDVDTLVWNSTEKWLYHNGIRTNKHNAIVIDLKK